MVTRRIWTAAAWTVICAACGLLTLSRACVWALAGDYPQAAFFLVATLAWLSFTCSARRRWWLRSVNAEAHRSLAEMARTRYRAPPGHAWRGSPVGTPAQPGWCLCGEQYRDQDECDAMNALNWRCEP